MDRSRLTKKLNYLLFCSYGRYFGLLLLMLLIWISSMGQNRPVNRQALAKLDSLHKKADRYFENRPAEKVYVHFDKSFYILGEVSWYKAYVVNESDFSPTVISSVLNVDWIDPSGKLIKHQRLKIENGGAAGDFAIDTTFQEGVYTVRAYTNWMRNNDPCLFFYKCIRIYDTKKASTEVAASAISPKIDFQFFPEGGTLVTGVSTQIAFKAIDNMGRGIDVKGNILDEQNTVIATIQSVRKGMGTFAILPVANKLYRAVLENGEVYPLPAALENGLVLSAHNMNPDKILVRIQSGKEPSAGVYLLGHSRGSITYAGYVKMDGNTKDISISKAQLPEGIFQLTLFDGKGRPQCHRKLFIKKDSSAVITIRSDKAKYAPRDSIILSFDVADSKGLPAKTSLSISVVDANFTGSNKERENIYTSLLLEGDMRGNIENPEWYFDSLSAQTKHALDLVMLTHGWSRYNWEKIIADEDKPIAFMPEKGILLEGEIHTNEKPLINTPFLFRVHQLGNDYTNIYQTDNQGHFYISDLDFFDSTLVSLRVINSKRVVENAKIRLANAQRDLPDLEYSSLGQFEEESKNKLVGKLTGLPVWKPDHYKMLEEVIVKGRVSKIRTVGMNAKLVKPGAIDLKSGLSTSQFISRYAMGVPFSTPKKATDGREIWSVGKILIDGVEATNQGFEGNPFVILNAIPIADIEHVMIASKRKTYFIAITTKKTSSQPLGTISLIAKGYDAAREFYHPKYGPLDSPSTLPDNRITIYWNANVETDKDGKATVKFYNSDYTERLHIIAEGIINGQPVSIIQLTGKAFP